MNREFVARLEAAIMARGGHSKGQEITFLCPCHDDHHPSARWQREKFVWYCHVCQAGGGAYDLAKRLGVELPEDPLSGLTLDALAEYVGLPVSFLRSVGLTEGVYGVHRGKCIDIPYLGTGGEVLGVHKRIRLAGEPRFVWRTGDHVLPYGLSRLPEGRKQGRLLFVEGDSDPWILWNAGFPALGLPGAGTWGSEWVAHCDGIPNIFIWGEQDDGGDSLVAKMIRDFPNARIITPPHGLKDPCALWHSCEHDLELFKTSLEVRLETARPASQIRAESLSKKARAVFAECQGLLADPNLVDSINKGVRGSGYAGDTRGVLTVYLALTSRLLERPLNVAIVAPSSAGKNAVVDAALPLFPPDSYYMVKAGSARSLIYSDEDFEHRTIIFAEADSLPMNEENPASSALRSLVEDQFMSYDVAEQDPATGQFHTRKIMKKGPTGLITTGVKPLKHQMDTRVLTLSVVDTEEQSRLVLASQAAMAKGLSCKPEVRPFVALQEWLSLAGERDVIIPFADQLADLIPVHQIRIRRDFRQLLTAIQTVALLFQKQRQRDAEGRIVASIEDYKIARDVLSPVFNTAASGGLTDAVRETVEAVTTLHSETLSPVTVSQVAGRLKLSSMGAWYRVGRALRLGYLVNQESRERQPAKLVPGDPLPDDKCALPPPEALDIDRGLKALLETPFNALTQPEAIEKKVDSVKDPPFVTALKPVSERDIPLPPSEPKKDADKEVL